MHHKDKRSEARERAYELSSARKESGAAVADLQRITFIYLSLLRLYPTNHCQFNGDINSQITSLCCMGLLARTSSATNLDVPRYRSLLSLDTAMEIAK
uniref:Origin recognition complex subunit 5 C-terminal domain-containing protein n=1 Tax=Heterorhabditis bacteriophora TaxID=37862 RepID=A0A1I7XJR6_HETBA